MLFARFCLPICSLVPAPTTTCPPRSRPASLLVITVPSVPWHGISGQHVATEVEHVAERLAVDRRGRAVEDAGPDALEDLRLGVGDLHDGPARGELHLQTVAIGVRGGGADPGVRVAEGHRAQSGDVHGLAGSGERQRHRRPHGTGEREPAQLGVGGGVEAGAVVVGPGGGLHRVDGEGAEGGVAEDHLADGVSGPGRDDALPLGRPHLGPGAGDGAEAGQRRRRRGR